MVERRAGLVIWDVDGTLIPADLRWLRRAVARTYGLQEEDVLFPSKRVHGYTDESIVVDTAIASGLSAEAAEDGVQRFHIVLADVMREGEQELARDQPAYPGAAESLEALQSRGYIQTVLTGNLRPAAQMKLEVAGLAQWVDWNIGAYGSDARDRFDLPAVVGQRFADRYGGELDPDRTVIIGDAPNDIACARRARFRVVAVAHRIGRDELAQYCPDAIVDTLAPGSVMAAVNSVVGADGH
ncbi:HAD family hydrolase [Nocardia transvalensis]|uniref:HAD family hydrolase n=1 Tax=Nocardia transvalensis TaxID=37333 RepID=UPI002B4B1CF2|nr:haloacid dehalogenase-like hydrolase [Nocardia transvalensis]